MAKLNNINQPIELLLNVVGFQCIWWLGVLTANTYLWLSAFLLIVHLKFYGFRREGWFVLNLALLGMLVDGALIYTGVYSFDSFPYWLILLWGGFACTLKHSLQFSLTLPIFFKMLFGAVGGGLSYYAGYKLGAVSFPYNELLSLIIVAVIWSVLFPVFTFMAAEESR